MKTRLSSFLALAVLAIAAATIGRAQVISTLSTTSFGTGGTNPETGWGQTFQTPGSVTASLDQFVVQLGSASGVTFQGFIATWTTTANGYGGPFSITEPILWSGTATGGTGNLVTFNTGSLALNPGTSYALYFIATNASANVPVIANTSYTAGGALIWSPTPGGFTPIFANNYSDLYDLQFEATFSAVSISPVPEPSTYATIGLALCGVLALIRRRRAGPTGPATAAEVSA